MQERAVDQPVLHPSNHLLASLPAADLAMLRPHLEPIEFVRGAVLYDVGDTIGRVYFPHSGIVSLVVDLKTGETVEAAMIGRDGVVGGSAALDGDTSLSRAIVQIPGAGLQLELRPLRQVAEQSRACSTMLIRHERTMLAQAQQGAACNAVHRLDARLARWLLWTRELTGSDTLPLTQEFLAEMLGVQRTSLSVVAHTLQQAGFIRYRRGHIRIIDGEGLREASCECYETLRSHYERLIGWRPI